jgi:hypothetical protein
MAEAILEKVKNQEIDVNVALIQGLIPLGLKTVEERLQREVELLAGKKQTHGKENVRWSKQAGSVYLRDQKILCKRQLQAAYAQTTYREAKADLEKLYRELQKVNQSAASSLMEGREETLTLHNSGLSPKLCKSLNTTNCMESIMSQLGQYSGAFQLCRGYCA